MITLTSDAITIREKKAPRDPEGNPLIYIDVEEKEIYADGVEHVQKTGRVHFYPTADCTLQFKPAPNSQNVFGIPSIGLKACQQTSLPIKAEGATSYWFGDANMPMFEFQVTRKPPDRTPPQIVVP